MKGRFATAGSMALVLGLGCSSSKTADPPPDGVHVDFYDGQTASKGCEGTLVAPRVVLTSAHCAEGTTAARVAGTDARAEVARVQVYDWTRDPVEQPTRHDLALLVLRSPLPAGSYGRVDVASPEGRSVVVDGAVADAHARVIATKGPSDRPFTIMLPHAAGDGGGAIRRTEDGAIVGVVIGAGARSGDGYGARLDDPLVIEWLKDIIDDEAWVDAHTKPGGGAITPKGLLPGAADDGDKALVQDNSDVVQAGTSRPVTTEAAPLPYSEPVKLIDDKPRDHPVRTGENYWADGTDDDPATGLAPTYAKYNDDAMVISGHGAPGAMGTPPSEEELKDMAARSNGRTFVLASCYSGVPGVEGGNPTPTSAAQIADTAGIPHEKIYGCTGKVAFVASGRGATCDGQWVDGNGTRLVAQQRNQYALLNCHQDADGKNATCDRD
jgi:hypothetical protein